MVLIIAFHGVMKIIKIIKIYNIMSSKNNEILKEIYYNPKTGSSNSNKLYLKAKDLGYKIAH